VIGEATVEVHVKRILSKLGFKSRAQVAVWVAERSCENSKTRLRVRQDSEDMSVL
jgi:Bacterial regulatory proteins, luxR family